RLLRLDRLYTAAVGSVSRRCAHAAHATGSPNAADVAAAHGPDRAFRRPVDGCYLPHRPGGRFHFVAQPGDGEHLPDGWRDFCYLDHHVSKLYATGDDPQSERVFDDTRRKRPPVPGQPAGLVGATVRRHTGAAIAQCRAPDGRFRNMDYGYKPARPRLYMHSPDHGAVYFLSRPLHGVFTN